MRSYQKKINDLRNLVEIQGVDGNWNQSQYMRGLYNGMELALSIFEEREPKYKDEPKRKGG